MLAKSFVSLWGIVDIAPESVFPLSGKGLGRTLVQSLHKKFPDNVDEVKSVILSKNLRSGRSIFKRIGALYSLKFIKSRIGQKSGGLVGSFSTQGSWRKAKI